jgi:hypothetical protein
LFSWPIDRFPGRHFNIFCSLIADGEEASSADTEMKGSEGKILDLKSNIL